MYSMKWETCSFMPVRHVPTREERCPGGGGGGSLLLYTLCTGVRCNGSEICTRKEERRCILVLLGGFSSPGHAHPMVYIPHPFQYIFFLLDTSLRPRHPANGVHGHPGPNYMYSMKWENCSFMPVRHVPTREGRCPGGGGGSLLLYTLCTGVSCHGSQSSSRLKRGERSKWWGGGGGSKAADTEARRTTRSRHVQSMGLIFSQSV